MKTKVLVGLLAVVGVSAVAPMAYADPTKKDDSYGYIFNDDALQALGRDANGAQILVRKTGSRERLLRPRVHFIAEMLKSVENM